VEICLWVYKEVNLFMYKFFKSKGLTMTKIIAVCNNKGGVGKTTTVLNISAFFAKNYKTLMIDFDPQGNLSKRFKTRTAHIKDFLEGGAGPVKVGDNLDILTADRKLTNYDYSLHSEVVPQFFLRDGLEKLGDYEYIFIDSPPAFGMLTINAITAANYALVPMEAEEMPTEGLVGLIEGINKIKQINDKFLNYFVFFNKFNNRTLLHRKMENTIRKAIPANVLKTSIRRSVIIPASQTLKQNIFEYSKKGVVTTDFENLCEELTGIFEEEALKNG